VSSCEAPIDYLLVRRRGRRGVGLKVDETGLTVNAPATMPLARIEALVRESERWVLRKIAEWSARQVPKIEWIEGARLPYLGGGINLRISTGPRAMAQLREGNLHVVVRSNGAADVKRAVVGWYKRVAQEYLAMRARELARAAGLALPHVRISPALARWGSCNARREVRLAWRLMKAPREMIDYVICHELAHIRQMNHSSAFWAEVERQCPDYRRLRDRLFATDHLYRSF